MTDEPSRPLPKGCRIGCLAFLVLAVVFGVWGFLAKRSGSSSNHGDDAVYACEKFVKDGLKAPATAEFSGEHAAKVSAETGTWSVAGSVDSENSFGVPIRNSFTCSVRARGEQDETWDLVTMTGLEN
ncbi:hypothetical protein [Actinomadura napierensis]|uniref:DUF4333 domain-containing protein n=1 Tax=Actinomadura napierensis TaxID=267854 RepID=A0ABP5L5V2_9ACTN